MQGPFRLRDNEDFQRVHRGGRRVVNQHLVLIQRQNGQETSRIGFAVSKKLGGAVVRNRIKRRLRSLAARRLKSDELPAGRDIVIIARHGVENASFDQLSDAFDDLLRRARWE